MDILYLLDRLDEMVASASRVPFSSRVILDEQDYLDIVDQIRLALPEELKVSRRVMAERDQILAEAYELRRDITYLGTSGFDVALEGIALRLDRRKLAIARRDESGRVAQRCSL